MRKEEPKYGFQYAPVPKWWDDMFWKWLKKPKTYPEKVESLVNDSAVGGIIRQMVDISKCDIESIDTEAKTPEEVAQMISDAIRDLPLHTRTKPNISFPVSGKWANDYREWLDGTRPYDESRTYIYDMGQ